MEDIDREDTMEVKRFWCCKNKDRKWRVFLKTFIDDAILKPF
jgi:hypothetical protein